METMSKRTIMAFVAVTLVLLLFGSMAVSMVTGNLWWFGGGIALDGFVIVGFALVASEEWF